MTSTEELKVTAIEVTGPVERLAHKTMSGGQYAAPIRYTLEDGRTVDSTYSARLKRDVLPGIEGQNIRASWGQVTATLEDGRLSWTSTAYGTI